MIKEKPHPIPFKATEKRDKGKEYNPFPSGESQVGKIKPRLFGSYNKFQPAKQWALFCSSPSLLQLLSCLSPQPTCSSLLSSSVPITTYPIRSPSIAALTADTSFSAISYHVFCFRSACPCWAHPHLISFHCFICCILVPLSSFSVVLQLCLSLGHTPSIPLWLSLLSLLLDALFPTMMRI